MSQDNPNMDEVVRLVKDSLEQITFGNWECIGTQVRVPGELVAIVSYREDRRVIANAPEWLRLLIEEREQFIQTLKVKDDTIATIERGYFYQLAKVAEQDKEIQQWKARANRVEPNW